MVKHNKFIFNYKYSILKELSLIFFLTFSLLACGSSKQSQNDSDSTDLLASIDKDVTPNAWSYQVLWQRNLGFVLTNPSLQEKIDDWLQKNQEVELEKLIDFLLDLTSDHLEFSFIQNNNNPDILINSKKANCIGYASFFSSIFQYSIQQAQLQNRYQCQQVVGKIFYLGQDAHQFFDNPFFADHDFIIIKDLETNQTTVIDPSFYAYLGVRNIDLKE